MRIARRTDARTIRRAVSLAAVAATVLSGCGSSDDSTSTSSSRQASTETRAEKTVTGENLRGKRYCEVLLLHPNAGGLTADVYNSFPMNACPEAQWAALDATAIASDNGVPIAVLNGPRYWLMDRVDKTAGEEVHQDFGGIDMIKRATVAIASLAQASTPYTPNQVSRATVFTFDAGQTVYELTGPDGKQYVMQSWSQQTDPALVESDLAGLAGRLQLPPGWTYGARKLTKPLRIVTTTTNAVVLQDELRNSYSLVRRQQNG